MTNSDLRCWLFGWGTGGESILKDVDSRRGGQSNPCNELITKDFLSLHSIPSGEQVLFLAENLGSIPEHPLQIILAGKSVSIFPP